MKPIRIQRKRTKGWMIPKNTVYVGRPTKFGNPFKVGEEIPNDKLKLLSISERDFYADGYPVSSNYSAVELYEKYVVPEMIDEIIKLKGKNLACWCKWGQVCHADVLLRIANE